MSAPLPGVALLAAALVPDRARTLLALHPVVDPEAVGSLLALPGAGRLGRLAGFLAAAGRASGPEDGGSGPRTDVRAPVAGEPWGGRDPADVAPAWPVLPEGAVLPFDLARAAPGLAALDPSLLALGARVARSAAAGLASVLGGEASISGRLLPGLAEPAGAALVPVDLTAIAGVATLAVERAFAARLAGKIGGAAGHAPAPGALSPAERAVLELAVLGALDAVAAETGVEHALAPRLALRGVAPLRPLCVELTVAAAGLRGRAILTLPEAALRALRGPPGLPVALGALTLPASVGSGEAALSPEDAAALGPGDVLLVGPADAACADVRVAGGLVVRGRLADGGLAVDRVEGAGDGEGSAPVPLRVELGEVVLRIADLARIAPGSVLPLGIDRGGAVTLRVGGRAIARGELVEIDGAVGVRIVGMEEQP